jgi:hypothetical protein
MRELVKLGFESIEPFFWQTMKKDLQRLAAELLGVVAPASVGFTCRSSMD